MLRAGGNPTGPIGGVTMSQYDGTWTFEEEHMTFHPTKKERRATVPASLTGRSLISIQMEEDHKAVVLTFDGGRQLEIHLPYNYKTYSDPQVVLRVSLVEQVVTKRTDTKRTEIL
jgi:hypothetical protein